MKNRRHQWVLSLALLSLGLVACHLLTAFTVPDTIRPEAEQNFRLMAKAWNTIQRFYVDQSAVESQRMTYGAISGMVDALGDTGHSRFLTPEMVKHERDLAKGKLEGIGAEIETKNGQPVIVAPIDGSPAQRAGLRPGDIILKVDGEETIGLPLSQVVERILGPAGTSVKLTILNPRSGLTKNIALVRARVTLQNITWERLPNTSVVHLRIVTFSEGVSKALRKTLSTIQEESSGGLILDLRNSPGGLYDEAVSTASQFLSGSDILLEKDASGKITAVPARPGGVALTIPMVVLINGGTSSGAEIVAGALQDAHRAKLVGEKTFGTGTVLETFSLSDGSALMLATKEWLTPAGRVIWHQGIHPDVLVSLAPEVTPLIPEGERGMTADKLLVSGDDQLLRALDLLTRQSKQETQSTIFPFQWPEVGRWEKVDFSVL
jgi:carboxyl-terminal processing protease